MSALENHLPLIREVLSHAGKVILGKDRELQLALACFLAKGHLLIEDLPGMGKTTLAKVFSKLLGLEMSRIQFTSDLLPADIIGVSIFDKSTQSFSFHRGPLFSHLVLGDELNRASPKTQSACLQAMEEYEVSIDGKTYALPNPFFFIATENPLESIGTFPLPSSQLDRFMMRIELGYPPLAAEKDLLLGKNSHFQLQAVLKGEEILQIQSTVEQVHVSEAIADYILELLHRTRSDTNGLSPRAGLNLLRASRAWAFLEGRKFVLPEDIKAVGPSVVGHRLDQRENGIFGKELSRKLFESVPIPLR